MQYKLETETVDIVGAAYAPITQRLLLTKNPEILRTRKFFIIILGILLILSVINVIFCIADFVDPNPILRAQRSLKLGSAIFAVLIYGFATFAVCQYSAICLRIFAWLCIIGLIGLGIPIALLLFAIIRYTITTMRVDRKFRNTVILMSLNGIFYLLGCITVFILSVIIVKLTFKLVRLIDADKRLIIQKI